MNRTEHLLACLAEECTEVGQRALKAQRFGVSEIQPGQTLDNFERMFMEFTDLCAVMEMLQKEIGVRRLVRMPEVDAKKEKVEKYMLYAESQGALKA
jgi:superfamily II helicase